MRKGILIVAAVAVLTGCGRSTAYYLSKGRELSSKQNYAEAALNYRKAIQKDSRSGEAYYQLGLTEIRLNMPRDAYQHLLRAVALLPGRDDVKATLAELSFNAYIGDRARPKIFYEQVMQLSDQLLAHNRESFDGLRLKGYLAASDKKLKEAEEFFAKANSVKPFQADLTLMWTETLFQDHQDAEGERLARGLIENNKSYGPMYDELFRHYTLLNRSTEAEEILKAKVTNNPADAEAALQLAQFYARSSRESEMEAVLRRMLDNPAAFPQAHLQVGDFYDGLQRFADAIRLYEEGARQNPKEKIVFLKRITNVWLSQGKGEQALEAVSELRKQDSSDEGAEGVQASLLLQTGRPEAIKQAAARFQDLVKKQPENAVWRFNLGRALAAQGDFEGARREYLEASQKKRGFLPPRIALAQLSQSTGDFPSALRYANEVLAIDPGRPAVRLIRAVSLMNTGNNAQARDELTKLERVFPDEVQFQYAILDLKDKRFKEAEGRFQKLLEKDPHNARAIFGLVQTEAAENQLGRALPLLHQELDRSPNSQVIRSVLAEVEVALGKFDPAIEEYRRLLVIEPRSAQFHLSLGRAYQLKGDLAKATAELREAGRLAPKDPGPPALLAHAMINAGKTQEALGEFRLALELRPGNAALMNDLAYLIAESGGDLDEALALAQKAVRASPDEPEMADTLASIYLKKNLNGSGLQILKGLVAKYPNQPSFRYHLGLALLQAGDREAAKREFKASLSQNPPIELRSEIEAALSKLG